MKDVMFACLTSTICILMLGCKGLTMIMLKKRILFCSKVVIFSLYKLISRVSHMKLLEGSSINSVYAQ